MEYGTGLWKRVFIKLPTSNFQLPNTLLNFINKQISQFHKNGRKGLKTALSFKFN